MYVHVYDSRKVKQHTLPSLLIRIHCHGTLHSIAFAQGNYFTAKEVQQGGPCSFNALVFLCSPFILKQMA